MAKTIKEERLRWVLPIVQKQIQLVDAARVCPYSTRSLERWVAAYRRGGEAALEPKSTARKTQENETPIRIKEQYRGTEETDQEMRLEVALAHEKGGTGYSAQNYW